MPKTVEYLPIGTQGWPLDRRVPLALILGIAAQTASLLLLGGWFVSKMDSRIEQIEMLASANRVLYGNVESRMRVAEIAAGKIETRLDGFDRRLDDMLMVTHRIEDMLQEADRRNRDAR